MSRGADSERRARKNLEAAGYVVVKSGGSLGCFDLIAINVLGIRGIQVKRDQHGTHTYPAAVERMREEMAALPLPSNMTGELWVERLVGHRLQWVRQEVLVQGGQQ